MTLTITNSGIGLISAFTSYAFGTWTELLAFFLLTIVIDIGTGLSASIKEGHGIASSLGFVGLGKKAFMFIAILLAHRIDLLMGTQYVMDGAIYFYLANELLSIVENYGRIGLPLPDGIRRVVAVLKGQSRSETTKDCESP